MISVASAQEAHDTARALIGAFVEKHCVHCHDAESRKGDVDLEATLAAAGPGGWVARSALLRRAVRRVRDGVMPPQDEDDRPDFAARLAFADAVDVSVRDAAQRVAVDPTAPVLRQLNRVQFGSAVRDLLSVDVDVARLLPEDPSGEGFDVVGDVQTISPLWIEGHVEAVDAIVDAVARGGDRFATAVASCDEDVEVWLRPLLRTAFRRPVEADVLATRATLFRSLIADGRSIAIARRRVLQSVLLSPFFLCRIEADDPDAPEGSIRALDDFEIASRLSFFLWSTSPDEELARCADQGVLHETDRIRAQVRRMLVDPRIRALSDEFAAQWLGFRRMRTLARDVRRYSLPDELRRAMYEEAARGFERIVREDRSLLELLDADWTFVDGALSGFYGIPAPPGDGPSVVTLTDRRRGGITGWAVTQAVNAHPTRTSPVLRGRFVLEELCGDPPPPPPPKIPKLPEDDRQADGLSLRQRLALHRSDPRCASCHALMDPLGLALEPFDGIGRFRSSDEDRPLDPCVTLPGGEVLDGPIGLKDWLLAREDRFVRTFAERLFVFAMGRVPSPSDERVILAMIDAAQRDDYRVQAVIETLCVSDAFRLRRRP
ncbi:MAG: DUF1592 domain-containing protein [Planctomycetota bacterium]